MIVGLTGNIGSGKSYVANIFTKKGIPVYNSDDKAKYLMQHNPELIAAITTLFGPKAYTNNQLNRQFIAEKIFTDKSLLQKINALVHPAVQKDFENWTKKNEQAPFVIKEAAILIESGAYKQCDVIILITAPDEIRKQRIRKRDNMSDQQILERMANQMPAKEKIPFANYIITNDGISVVTEQINKIYHQLLNKTK